jgi:protein SCO1/2
MTASNAPRARIACAFALLAASCLALTPSWAAGNPFDQSVTPVLVGERLPATTFIDQHHRRFSFDTLAGQTVVASFIFTRCKDECPLITQRFVRLDRLLGRGPYTLALVTIDPARDTPAVIAAYASKYRLPGRVHLLTGSPDHVNAFVRASGVSVIDNGSGDLIHNTKLFIIDRDGRLADVVDDPGWSPADVAAQVEHVAGASSSLVARVDFQLTNEIANLCGGSFQTASGILDALAAGLVITAGIIVLAVLRRRIFAQGS